MRPPPGDTARFQTPLGTRVWARFGSRHKSGAFSLNHGSPHISSCGCGRSSHWTTPLVGEESAAALAPPASQRLTASPVSHRRRRAAAAPGKPPSESRTAAPAFLPRFCTGHYSFNRLPILR